MALKKEKTCTLVPHVEKNARTLKSPSGEKTTFAKREGAGGEKTRGAPETEKIQAQHGSHAWNRTRKIKKKKTVTKEVIQLKKGKQQKQRGN